MQPPNPYAPPNPYGAPQAVPYGQMGAPGGPYAAWPDGEDLAIQKEAPLPAVCMKCGSMDAPHRRNQQFVFSPPWVIVVVVISPLIGAIIMLLVQKKGRLHVPLCNQCHARWKNGILLMILAIVGLFVGFILGVVAIANELPELGIPLMVGGFVALIAIAIANRNRFLRVRKVDDRMITLRQVHPHAAQVILQTAQWR